MCRDFSIYFINKGHSMLDKLKKILDKNKYDIISFDIFDTLLLRPYARPSNVFQHLEKINIAIGFSAVRKIAENNLVEYKDIKYANYDEIYSILPSDFQFLKDKEIELEKDTIYANPEMKEIFNYAKSLNKRIILTSDMYFSSDILDDILKKNGFTGYEKIYVSSGCRKAKHDGTLYKHIIQDLNVATPKSILHIGNNKSFDYKTAKNSNLDAFHYIEPKEQFFKEHPKFKKFYYDNINSLTAGIIIGILVKNYIENKNNSFDYWKYFGYFLGGPVCYGISKFLYDRVIDKNIKEVIFVARDGYTIEKIFNLFNKNNEIKTHYIYAPRTISILTNIDYKNNFYWNDRLNSLIKLLKELSPDLTNKINKLSSNKEKENFIKKNISFIKPISKKMKNNYLKYINKRFNIKRKNIAIFDIVACNFSSLKLLNNALNKKNIYAIYWGISKKADREGIDCIAYQKDFTNPIQNYNVLEFLITAPELPIKYMDENGCPISVYNKEELDRMNYYSIIYEQEINFCKDLLSAFKNYTVNFACNELINLINLFFNNLDSNDKKYLKNIKHGVDEAHTIYKNLFDIKK